MPGTVDDKLVKRAHSTTSYTKQQLEELAACMHPVTGPEYFIKNFMYIQHPMKGAQIIVPFDYQYDLLETYHNYRYSVNLMARQTGKALALDTPILTPTGFTTVGDIKVGDVIYSRDGSSTNVTFITEVMNDRPCYEVEFDNGECIVADAEHLWNVSSSYKTFKHSEKTLTTSEMVGLREKWNKWSKPPSLYINYTECLEFEDRPVLVDPYVFGVWLGDGHSSCGRITCHKDDYEHYFKEITSRGYSVSDFKPDKRTDTTGYFTVYGLLQNLRKLGVVDNKHIPDEYFINSKGVRQEVIQGLMDTDGYISEKGQQEFSQSNRTLVENFNRILSSLGIKSTVNWRKTSGKLNARVRFTTEVMTYRIPRKKRILLEHSKKNYHANKATVNRIYIKDIRPVDSVPVRCLQVDNPEHLFLCGETLIPTHNTTIAAGYLLWYAMFVPDAHILIASNKYEGAQEIMHRIRYAYEECPDHIRAGSTSYNKKTLEFDNKSRIESTATTGNTGRGKSISLLYLDEFAFVEPGIAKEFWAGISPTLSTGGKCIITSTPSSSEDQFAEIWFGSLNTTDEFGNERPRGIGKNGFKSYFADWRVHPDRNEEWAEEEKAKLGDEKFKIEHECQFLSHEETLISNVALQKLAPMQPMYKTGQVRWFAPIKKECSYVVALDPSMGTGGDNAAIQVLELPTFKQVAEWQHNKSRIEQQMNVVMEIGKIIEKSGAEVYWSVENNSLGEAALVVIRNIGEEKFAGTFLSDPRNKTSGKRKGFNTTNVSKKEACARLKTLIETERMTIYSKNLVSELKTFVHRGNSYEAMLGMKDDLVMSMLLAVRMAAFVAMWDDSTHHNMNSSPGIEVDDDDEGSGPMPMMFI